MAKVNSLGTDNLMKLVLRLAIPSMFAQFVNVLYGIVDRIYIGNIDKVGEIALAGAGICGPIVTLISSFAFLVGIGGAPLLAIRLGENNREGAKKILANCFIMLLTLSVVLTVFFLCFKKPLLMWFGASEHTFIYADQYLTIYTLGSIFAILSIGLNQFIVCQGFSTAAMITILIGAILNIVLDPIFIFKLNMGVKGAAIATVISQAVSCFYVILFLLGKRVYVRITFGNYSLKIMKRVLIFGFSPFVIIATDSVIVIVLNSVLQKYGGSQNGDMFITCATIVQSYMQLITMPMIGITGGTQSILSFNYGAKNIDRIKQGEKCILALCIIFTAIMFILSQVIPQFFVHIFTQNKQYVDLSVWGIKVFTSGIILLAFQYTFVDGLTALGISKAALSLSLFRKSLFLVLILVLPVYYGVKGAFYAEPVADIVGGIVSTTVFLLIINKFLKRREEMADGEPLYG